MKILAFVDLHADMNALKKIKAKIKKEKVELVLCGGDMSIFGDNLFSIMRKINDLGVPVLTIHGNHEFYEEIRHLSSRLKNIINLHKKLYRKKGFIFLGYGGGGFSLTDPKFTKTMSVLMKKVKKGEKVVLMTHAPPYGTVLDKINRSHVGNKSITSFIKKAQPLLFICGHIEECDNQTAKIGKTKIMNPGYQGKVITI